MTNSCWKKNVDCSLYTAKVTCDRAAPATRVGTEAAAILNGGTANWQLGNDLSRVIFAV